MKAFWFTVALVVLVLLSLRAWRYVDDRALDRRWESLIGQIEVDPPEFDSNVLSDLPEPARRFLSSAIRPGTRLFTAAEIAMHGEFSLGTIDKPDYRSMHACQLLAAPTGFVWEARIGDGALRIVGSDAAFPGGSWTRFWLAGLLPVARLGGDVDHEISAFGRYMAEAIFWTPAALLPSAVVEWNELGEDEARVTITHDARVQSFDVMVDELGQPIQVTFQRWSDANSEHTYRRQPFGGVLSDFREFAGYRLPTSVEAGNHFGTSEYFPFFRATVDSVSFVHSPDAPRGCRLS